MCPRHVETTAALEKVQSGCKSSLTFVPLPNDIVVANGANANEDTWAIDAHTTPTAKPSDRRILLLSICLRAVKLECR